MDRNSEIYNITKRRKNKEGTRPQLEFENGYLFLSRSGSASASLSPFTIFTLSFGLAPVPFFSVNSDTFLHASVLHLSSDVASTEICVAVCVRTCYEFVGLRFNRFEPVVLLFDLEVIRNPLPSSLAHASLRNWFCISITNPILVRVDELLLNSVCVDGGCWFSFCVKPKWNVRMGIWFISHSWMLMILDYAGFGLWYGAHQQRICDV